MWVEILNKSFKEPIKIKKDQPLGFVVVEPEHLTFKYETSNSKKRKPHKRKKFFKKQQRQTTIQATSGLLNRYDFAYTGKDMVNQGAKVTPGVIKATTNNINAIATDRINQVISDGGKEMERVLPKLLRGANEDVYQTPFRLIGKFLEITIQ